MKEQTTKRAEADTPLTDDQEDIVVIGVDQLDQGKTQSWGDDFFVQWGIRVPMPWESMRGDWRVTLAKDAVCDQLIPLRKISQRNIGRAFDEFEYDPYRDDVKPLRAYWNPHATLYGRCVGVHRLIFRIHPHSQHVEIAAILKNRA